MLALQADQHGHSQSVSKDLDIFRHSSIVALNSYQKTVIYCPINVGVLLGQTIVYSSGVWASLETKRLRVIENNFAGKRSEK